MYDSLKERFVKIVTENSLGTETVKILARTLSPEEAIGNPEDNDGTSGEEGAGTKHV